MKVSLNWLSELIELPPTVPALVDLLTLAGVEVEGVHTTGCAIPNVVVAEIKESVQHPNADRLSVCQVDDGSGALRQIVCGAKNYKLGDKVPCALPGAKLSADFTIKAGKLRSVDSNGMLCSADELGLPKGADGLLILPADAKPGTPIGELFAGDTVLDLEITPNRPDLLSHAGIAVEIGALTAKAITRPPGPLDPVVAGNAPAVSIETTAPCLYTARRIAEVRVGASPNWLRTKLESIGLRAINNVVDVTNFVMMASGQPLHAFDAAKLRGSLRVRHATTGETFLALDGKSYTLSAEDMVIADDDKAVAIAGIMGGEATGVTATTTDVVLESAYFDPATIRRSSRRLGLSSDSSYRFERGVYLDGVERASLCAAKYIAELTSASSISPIAEAGHAALLGQRNVPHPAIALRPERIAAVLGVAVPEDRIAQILTGFGLVKVADGWQPPGFRLDLAREIDLVEEIARVIGMETIPARTQARFAPASATDRNYDRAMSLRRALIAQGLHEARSITLVPTDPRGLAYTKTSPDTLQRVKNPMNDEQVVLRPNLLHGLLTAVTTNLRAGVASVRLFEIGRVFSTQRPEEFQHAAIILSGSTAERGWRTAAGRDADIFDLKGILATAIGAIFKPDTNPALALSLIVEVAGKPVGHLGQLWPADARALDATAPVVFAEIDLVALWKVSAPDAAKKYREIPRFPSTTRDIALLAPLDLAHDTIATTLAKANEPLLAGVELFDLFTDPSGTKVPAGQKSLAYSLTYRSTERTLTADEVNTAHARLRERLKTLRVALRE